jgi:hypothetical protein
MTVGELLKELQRYDRDRELEVLLLDPENPARELEIRYLERSYDGRDLRLVAGPPAGAE